MWETPHQTSSLCFGEQGLLLTPSWSYAAETTQVSASGVEESHTYRPCRWLPRRGPCSSAWRGHPGDRLRFRWDSPQLPGGLPHNLSLPRPQWGAAARLKPGQKLGTSGSSEFKTRVFHFLPCLRGCSENSSADLPKWKGPAFGHDSTTSQRPSRSCWGMSKCPGVQGAWYPTAWGPACFVLTMPHFQCSASRSHQDFSSFSLWEMELDIHGWYWLNIASNATRSRGEVRGIS